MAKKPKAAKKVDPSERLIELAKRWSSPIPWTILRERFEKWQSARDYANDLRRIAWKLRDAGEPEEKGLQRQIADAEHEEQVHEKHFRALEDEAAELERLVSQKWPDLLGSLTIPDHYLPRERHEQVRRVLARLQADGGQPGHAPPMTETEHAVYCLLGTLAPGKGLTGKEIIQALGKKNICLEQSTLTRHIIPPLKKHRNVKNRKSVGYYIAQTH
ncbi:MAG: hypothetical protein FJ143_03795 [Deltaproteobacteria bacterium]|nr:hypothetical protein [Deltaproteobacteria bacterium]